MTFDLDAVHHEATAEPFEFIFGGNTYTLPPSVDMFAVTALQRGDLYGGLSRLLGAEQLDQMLASDAVFDEKRLAALMEAYGKHLGVTLGESAGSTGS